ncbi:unnamed protein product [Effrenium voratum]|nr:unnamed protein product [Effrenium voratum]
MWKLTPSAARFAKGLRQYHVAVVGSGPAGFYTSKFLLKKDESMKIDMFERLPTPFGLVRFGVAPDHPEVKNVINDFTAVAAAPNFRFFGNTEIGPEVPLERLRQIYDAVILCSGASGERRLGIPGEDAFGVVGAPAFVKWYNSHPDYQELQFNPPGEAAVVVGQGNVALDVARLLLRSPPDLHATDMDSKAVEAITGWQKAGLRTVHIVGRRGFIQAAFTNAELRELLTTDGLLPVVDPEELALCRNEASEAELKKSRMKQRSLDILQKMVANFSELESTSKRILRFHFLRSPLEVLSTQGALTGIRMSRNQLSGEPGKQQATPADASQNLEVSCGLLVRSVGFDILPMAGLPLSSNRVPHRNGCVESAGPGSAGLYVSGWLKRGPTGIIGSNIGAARLMVSFDPAALLGLRCLCFLGLSGPLGRSCASVQIGKLNRTCSKVAKAGVPRPPFFFGRFFLKGAFFRMLF